MYNVITEDKENGVFEYLVNDIRLKIDYEFYKEDQKNNTLSLDYFYVSAIDNKSLIKLVNVLGTNLLRFELVNLNLRPSDLLDAADALLKMSHLLDCFQEIVSRNFPFDFTKEQEIL
jgi:hypothetical protein